jgi:ribosomal protein L18E
MNGAKIKIPKSQMHELSCSRIDLHSHTEEIAAVCRGELGKCTTDHKKKIAASIKNMPDTIPK